MSDSLFVNCGVTGPAPPTKDRPGPWTSRFTSLLDDRVKMTGLSMNCRLVDGVHIQSMAYALDRVGLDLVVKSGAIFDCLEKPHRNHVDYIVENYEKKMGKVILDAGYALRLGGSDVVVTKSNVRDFCAVLVLQLEGESSRGRRRGERHGVDAGMRREESVQGYMDGVQVQYPYLYILDIPQPPINS